MTIKIETKWFVEFPREHFVVQFQNCNNEKEVRAKAREYRRLKKLPNNTKVYSRTEKVKYDI